MTQLKAIDVGIGLAVFYLVLTFGASALVEMISLARNWRGRILWDAIDNMLTGSPLVSVQDVYNNPLIKALGQNREVKSSRIHRLAWYGWEWTDEGKTSRIRRLPSYIPAATFSAAIVEKLIELADPVVLSPDEAIKWFRTLLRKEATEENPRLSLRSGDALRSILETTLVTQGSSIQSVRFSIEKWFNDAMDRTSGWYKRRTQSSLLAIGLIVAFGANLSTVSLARWAWNGDAARQATLAAADDYLRTYSPADKSGVTGEGKRLTDMASEIVKTDQTLFALGFPVGWNRSYMQERNAAFWILEYVAGCLLTAFAISMGSTFWFDALESLVNIRGAGPKPS